MAAVPDLIDVALAEAELKLKPQLKFRMKRSANIGKAMKAFCQKQGLELDAMEFVFNDRLLQPTETLASIGFEEGQQIICRPKTDADHDEDNANVNGTGRDLPVVYPSSLSFYEYPTSDIHPLDLNGPPSDIDVIANDREKFGCHIFVLKNNPVFRNVYLKYEEVEDHSDDENAGAPAKKISRATKKRGSKQDDGRRERRSIVLPDMTSDVLRVMLLNIYHGSLTFDVSIAHFVLQAAETHELLFLKRECEAAMSKNISQQNLINYFQVSEMANSNLVKKKCLKFLKKNIATIEVLDEWNDFIKSAGSDVKTANLIKYIIKALAVLY